ncbi:hydroxymethylbilane synthase [Sulfurimonas denitrificans DSM 1251]|jgi:hydroxymethylbilane synthase|uniref:Porphobilinogen deaminase n=1 Tax=Sulfurimonas denitrificans (strain ATCC 33889 / DSM 1251) TaxID=326298 RepID=HEM3_SULDN|nr:hydroxymethylbilane synthase [Sulfurimonas denitrificans]Q30S90.1 RecName: Full=Porphobilinogen deaminase; Short=PBG; AltName: Full=Hydroxymethylbilane synthase; Short=HMBS; AltName: Full=Pre-uroporphyrinogen synthase [Sulfurimonas denitrificans DSM 1251]ABB44141.1 hydroxymethylbilane synthase [Sulfurimonas denitrificans DSM 1251]MDD3441850.1 hydroxymethylbilane synthase [Sulfurimonas denitrificans]
MKKLVIATRGSQLALWQSNHIKAILQEQNPGLEVELNVIVTTGDRIQDKALSKIGGKGLFLKELEEAMLQGEAQIAVHSLKDVPTVMPDGLILAAITEREDSRDALLSEKYANIDALPKNAVVGTSSLRRRMQIQKLRPDLIIKDLRGNVDTRIRKLKEGEFDAIILAAAGINRLSLLDAVKHVYPISLEEMVPSMGQGALGIEAVNDAEVLRIVAGLEDEYSRIETTIERSFVDELEGGCQVPIGVNASVLDDGTISIRAVLGLPNGEEMLSDSKITSKKDYENIGREIAAEFIEKGAKELLSRAEAMMENK